VDKQAMQLGTAQAKHTRQDKANRNGALVSFAKDLRSDLASSCLKNIGLRRNANCHIKLIEIIAAPLQI